MRRLAGVAWGGLLAVVLTAGCSAGAPASGLATFDSCAAFGLRAIQRHAVVTAGPRACAGLSHAQVNMAVARAIREAVGPEPKAIARHLAEQDSGYLAPMLSTIPAPGPAPAPAPAAAAPARSPARSPAGLPLGIAALLAWVCTAAAGAYLMAGWLSGVMRRRRLRLAGLVPVTVFGHFGLAVAGLGIWLAFLITGAPVLAWVGVGLIVVIAGLGMGALSAALPEPSRGAAPARARLPVTVIAIHGMLATATILLVLLAAIGGSR